MIGEAFHAKIVAGAKHGKGNAAERFGGVEDGVERKLRRVGAVGEPIGRGGAAGLVVQDERAGLRIVDAVDAEVEAHAAERDIGEPLLLLLDAEGGAFELDVQPGPEE